MRSVLLIILVSISFSASAQWWRIDLKLKKKPVAIERPPALEITDHSIARLPHQKVSIVSAKVYPPKFERSDYSFEAEEAAITKVAQHNMRYNVQALASYNFNELARLYAQQKRFIEAKWFFLQSLLLSRQRNDDKLTVTNLIDLAGLKIKVGDYALAKEDLAEASAIAASKGLKEYQADIQEKLMLITVNESKSLVIKPVTSVAKPAITNPKPVVRDAAYPKIIAAADNKVRLF